VIEVLLYDAQMTERAGVRELRQNLSKYLERVKEGSRFEVTERGKPVALLVPLDDDNDPITRLERRGLRLRRASGRFEDLLPIPERQPGQRPLSEVLEEMRSDERY
jgi:prevent-host-death family protein